MDLTSIFEQLGIALGLGLLVGLQRERAASRVAGFRTFPLVTVLGMVCALIAQSYGGWIIALGFLALAGLIIISLGSYIVYRFFGENAGIALGGILGGMISSTATTVGYAKRTTNAPAGCRAAAIVIMIASTMVFVRVLMEIAVVAPAFFPTAFPPFLVMILLFSASSLGLWLAGRKEPHKMPVQENPSELKPALLFGLLFGVVFFAAAAAKDLFGQGALYIVGGLSGLTDMDAITLSTSQLVSSGRLGADNGWKIILVASMSNLVFKAAAIAVLGHRQLLGRIAVLYGFALLAGVLLLLSWPLW